MFEKFALWSTSNTVLMFSSGPATGETIGEMFGEALYHASLSQDEYRQLLKDHVTTGCENARGRSGLCWAYGVVGTEVLKNSLDGVNQFFVAVYFV